MSPTPFDREVDRNYDAFAAMLPEILSQHRDQFALMHDGQVVAYCGSESEALAAGRARYADHPFSVQQVTDLPVDLGFFSHAIDHRIA